MGGKDFIAAVLIVFLSLWSALYLETSLKSYFVLELFVIVILLIVSAGILYAIFTGKTWAWNASAVFFLAGLINSIFLYFGTRSVSPFLIALFSNLAGLALAGSNSFNAEPVNNSYGEKNELFASLEPYNLDTDSLLDKPVKKARKKSVKKSGGKKKKRG